MVPEKIIGSELFLQIYYGLIRYYLQDFIQGILVPIFIVPVLDHR